MYLCFEAFGISLPALPMTRHKDNITPSQYHFARKLVMESLRRNQKQANAKGWIQKAR